MENVIQLNNLRKNRQSFIYKVSNNLRYNGFYTADFSNRRFTDESVDKYPLSQLRILYPSYLSLIVGNYIIGKDMINIADLLFEDKKRRASFYNQWVLSVSDSFNPKTNKKDARLCQLLLKIAEEYNVNLAISGSVIPDNKVLEFKSQKII